jgi:hypothetical protein
MTPSCLIQILCNELDGTQSVSDEAGAVSICGQIRRGRKISFDADQWFSTFLSSGARNAVSCSLVRCEAIVEQSNVPGSSGSDIAFANTAQFLLLSLESVAALTQVRRHRTHFHIQQLTSLFCIVRHLLSLCTVDPRLGRNNPGKPEHHRRELSAKPARIWRAGCRPPGGHLAEP